MQRNKFVHVGVKRTLQYLTYCPYARFTLADPMPRLGSDVVGGNSGRNHPTSRRHTIHIGRVARNASVGTRESYIIVRLPGWYGERVLFITTLNCVVHVRLPIGRRRRAILNMFNIARWPPAPDGLPMRPDGRFRVGRPFTLAEPTAYRGTIGASDRLMWSGHYLKKSVLATLNFWEKHVKEKE